MRTIFAALIASVAFSVGATAFAQDSGEKSKGKTEYNKKTKYDFEDDVVEGELLKPDGDFVGSRAKTKQSSLIKIREDFVPEMLKSVSDI
jgi:hypothetical protein